MHRAMKTARTILAIAVLLLVTITNGAISMNTMTTPEKKLASSHNIPTNTPGMRGLSSFFDKRGSLRFGGGGGGISKAWEFREAKKSNHHVCVTKGLCFKMKLVCPKKCSTPSAAFDKKLLPLPQRCFFDCHNCIARCGA